MTRSNGSAGLRGVALGMVLPALLLVLWQASALLGWARPNLLPPPTAVLATLIDLAKRGELWGHIEITLVRVLFGFLIGTAAGTVLGALTGYSQIWRQLLDSTLQALRAIPSIAWVPLFILWLGIFEAAKVTLIAGDEPLCYRIASSSEDDGEGRRCPHGGQGGECASPGDDDIDVEGNQFGRQSGKPLGVSLRPPIFDRDVSTVDVARLVQALTESGHARQARV
jgi:hypothetical protein